MDWKVKKENSGDVDWPLSSQIVRGSGILRLWQNARAHIFV